MHLSLPTSLSIKSSFVADCFLCYFSSWQLHSSFFGWFLIGDHDVVGSEDQGESRWYCGFFPRTISLEDQGILASQPIASTEGMSSMASFLPSSLYALVSILHPQYLHQTMPLNSSVPMLSTPLITAPTSYSLFANPSSTSYSLPQPTFNQSLSLPSLSETQKLTSNNYHTWHLFMQLLLVWECRCMGYYR